MSAEEYIRKSIINPDTYIVEGDDADWADDLPAYLITEKYFLDFPAIMGLDTEVHDRY